MLSRLVQLILGRQFPENQIGNPFEFDARVIEIGLDFYQLRLPPRKPDPPRAPPPCQTVRFFRCRPRSATASPALLWTGSPQEYTSIPIFPVSSDPRFG